MCKDCAHWTVSRHFADRGECGHIMVSINHTMGDYECEMFCDVVQLSIERKSW